MEDFIATYLVTVTQDTTDAYDMLTPTFQQESGKFGRLPRVLEERGERDPEQHPGGSGGDDRLRRRLRSSSTSSDHGHAVEKDGSSFLIAGEA